MLDYSNLLPEPICVGPDYSGVFGADVDPILAKIEVPLGYTEAFKVVALRSPEPFRSKSDHVKTVIYRNHMPRVLASSSLEPAAAVTYFPGWTSTPYIAASRLFVFARMIHAINFAAKQLPIYRCFVPDNSRYFDEICVPSVFSVDNDSRIKSLWDDGELVVGKWRHLKMDAIILAKEVTLMNRLDRLDL